MHRLRALYRARYMTWLDKLEKRIGFIAIPGLIRIVIASSTSSFSCLVWLNPDFRLVLDLNPARILHGEVWRLVTYIFLPAIVQLVRNPAAPLVSLVYWRRPRFGLERVKWENI